MMVPVAWCLDARSRLKVLGVIAFPGMAIVHNAGKLKFKGGKKGIKRKMAFLNNWTPWN
jgi:hypothetical protein